MVTAQGSRGDIVLFHDFTGAEIPITSAQVVSNGAHEGYNIGPFKVTGKLSETDTGAISVPVTNGALRLSGNNEAGEGAAIGTEVIFSASLNGTLSMETRVQRVVLTAGVVWAGYVDLNEDLVNEPVTSTGTTLTLVASDLAGFLLDSQLTATADWHMPFNGGETSGPTDSQVVVTGTSNARNVNSVAVQTAVAGEWDLLQMSIYTNGTVKWWINEVLVQQQANAVSTSVDLACWVGVHCSAATLADLDVDYLDIRAKRDWAR